MTSTSTPSLDQVRFDRLVSMWTERLTPPTPEYVIVEPEHAEEKETLRRAARHAARRLKIRIRTSVLRDGRIMVYWLGYPDNLSPEENEANREMVLTALNEHIRDARRKAQRARMSIVPDPTEPDP